MRWQVTEIKSELSCFFLNLLYFLCSAIANTKKHIQEQVMGKTATIQTRVDPDVKNQAQIILKKLNISMSEAISMYLSQITLHQGIPFEIKIPNAVTAKTLKDSEEGKDLHKVDSVDELFQELDS